MGDPCKALPLMMIFSFYFSYLNFSIDSLRNPTDQKTHFSEISKKRKTDKKVLPHFCLEYVKKGTTISRLALFNILIRRKNSMVGKAKKYKIVFVLHGKIPNKKLCSNCQHIVNVETKDREKFI
jgi:hypothetical protein